MKKQPLGLKGFLFYFPSFENLPEQIVISCKKGKISSITPTWVKKTISSLI